MVYDEHEQEEAQVNFLYLHGFGSSPASKKGHVFTEYFAERGIRIERLDLRVPSPAHLRLSAMIETAQAKVGDGAILIGSSLGALTAARVAERELKVRGLILLAPAFQLAKRWREALPGFSDWVTTGFRTVTSADGTVAELDFGFVEDVEAIDVGFPDARCPTLVFHGTHDEAVPIEHSQKFVASHPNARLFELDDDHELLHSLAVMLPEAATFIDQATANLVPA